jgi:hypothetical protein
MSRDHGVDYRRVLFVILGRPDAGDAASALELIASVLGARVPRSERGTRLAPPSQLAEHARRLYGEAA